jgi:hypothetical protein
MIMPVTYVIISKNSSTTSDAYSISSQACPELLYIVSPGYMLDIFQGYEGNFPVATSIPAVAPRMTIRR